MSLTTREIAIIQAYFDFCGNTKKVESSLKMSSSLLSVYKNEIMRKVGLKRSWIKVLQAAYRCKLVDVKPLLKESEA